MVALVDTLNEELGHYFLSRSNLALDALDPLTYVVLGHTSRPREPM